MSGNSWGGSDRYYAEKSDRPDDTQKAQHFASPELVYAWERALKEIYPDLIERIERTYKNWHQALRAHLRDETGLKHPSGHGKRSLSVTVVPGLPRKLGEILLKFKGIEWLLLGRDRMEGAKIGTEFILQHHDSMQPLFSNASVPASKSEVENSHNLAVDLLQKCDLKALETAFASLREDVLGAYFFYHRRIELYWMAIGILSSTIRVSPESLTVVVLIHELAHAHTHEGRDIGEMTWRTEDFANAEDTIVEGLAQFYTDIICNKLESQDPSILEAYKRLLELQGGPYRIHENWLKWARDAGEIVRAGLIAARTKSITRYCEFEEALVHQWEFMKREATARGASR